MDGSLHGPSRVELDWVLFSRLYYIGLHLDLC